MNPPAEQHSPPGQAASSGAAGEPAPADGTGHAAGGHGGSNGAPGTPSGRRALYARDAAARASAAVPEQRRPGSPGRASAGPDAGSPERDGATPSRGKRAAPGDSGPRGEEDEPGPDFSIEAIDGVEEEVVGPNWLAGQLNAAGRRLGRLGMALAVIAVRDRLAALAVLLQGVGGAIFPPIWIIGALITAMSRKWDLRDKWLGLALPVLAVIFGATVTIVLGGQHASLGSYALEAWLAVGRLSRIAAVLGAVYLLWRLHRGLRDPRQPPWSRARRRA